MPALVATFPFDLFGHAGAGAGARLLAEAIREMLADNRREKQPSRVSAYQDKVRLREVDFETMAEVADWRKMGRQLARSALQRGDFLIWLGGNHLSVLPVLEELGALADTCVVQFDAHLDVYNLSDCTTELSHGNFLLHAAEPLPPIAHVGHRDLFLPTEHVSKHFREVVSAEEMSRNPQVAVSRLKKFVESAKRLWIDIDCDVLDPASFPATGHTLPFGLMPMQLLHLLDAIWSDHVAGVSISEFEPARDQNDRCVGMLIWLIEWLLLKKFEKA